MCADYVIGVDQGTSSTKALLLDADGRIVAEAGRPMTTAHPEPGWVEQDPEAMLANVVACVRELLETSAVTAESIAGIGIDNHTETLVLWDQESGRSVHPAIIWQCRRSTAETEAVDRPENRRFLRRRTGLDLDPTFTATKLSWIFRNRPDIADGVRAGKFLWGTVDCWLIWQLTGGAVYATESSNASRTLLFDIGSLSWDSDLIALFRLDLPRLPELKRTSGPFGVCHPDHFGTEIPITATLGDQQAALFGHGCLTKGAFKCTYGTGAFVWMNAGHDYKPVEGAGYLQTVAWHLERPTYALEGFIMYAGATLDWLADHLHLCVDAADVVHRAEQAGSSAGVALVPAFQGLASPWWNPKARAALFGLDSASGDGEVCHAALEAVCFQVRRVLEDMASAEVSPGGTVRCDGGLSRSAYFLQLQADILRMPVRRADIEHLTAYGTALMAGLGAGLWRDLAELRSLTSGGATYEPEGQASTDWSGRYRAWCQAVEQSLAWGEQ